MGEVEEILYLSLLLPSLINSIVTQVVLRHHFTVVYDMEQFRDLGNLPEAGSAARLGGIAAFEYSWFVFFCTIQPVSKDVAHETLC